MHQFFEPVIRPILEIVRPRAVVEIGSDQGLTTKMLLGLPEETCGVVHVIDPLPKYDPKIWREEFGTRFALHQQLSLNALGQIPLADAYFIDGDHNWFTVLNELRLIDKLARKAGREFPLVLLHDTSWPYGRRDLYYNPEHIPEGQRQPYKKEGLLPGKSELAGQNGLNVHLNHSIYENEIRNGVLTAVEDFVNESSLRLRITSIDAFFGLTVLVSHAVLDKTPALSNLLEQFGGLTPPLAGIIKKLESARVDGEIIKQKLKREQNQLENKHAEEIGRISSELASTRIERDALRVEFRTLAQRLETLEVGRAGLMADLSETQSRLTAAQAEKTALDSELSATRLKFSEQASRLNDAADQLSTSQQQNHALAQQLETLEADRAGLMEDLSDTQSRLTAAQAEKTALDSELSATRLKFSEQASRLNDAADQLSTSQQQNRVLEAERGILKENISETKASLTHRLQDLQQAFSQELARLQRQAEKLETGIAGAPESSWGQNLLSVIGLGQHYRVLSMLARLAAIPGANAQHPRRLFLARVRRHGWKGAVERLDKDYERALDLAEREGRAQGWQQIGGSKRHQQRMLWRLRDRAQDLANSFISGISSLESVADRLDDKPINANLPAGIQKDIARSSLVDTSHTQVDIVVPVFNALADVGQCLLSVLEHTSDPYRIIVVNDASAPETTHWLRWFANRHPGRVTLLENEVNQGYTRAINRGIQTSQGAYVLLLNSDTIVTPAWLDRLCTCAASSPRIGIVGPLSNAASWQNVPELLATDGSFAVNELPSGWIPADMAEIVSRCAPQPCYPRVPFVNGFCYLIKREVIEAIGLFDEVAFPRGYGEENDFSLRCADAGFELVIADNCYVFHAKSRSFGHEQRKELSQAGKLAFETKHDKARIRELIAQVKNNVILQRIRQQVLDAQNRAIACGMAPARDQNAPPRILFLLPVNGGGGGAHSVVQEVSAMRSMGVDAAVVIKKQSLEKFRSDYSRLPNVDDLFLTFEEPTLLEVARGATVVVATIFTSVKLLARIKATYPAIVAAYYIQDYEPLFFGEEKAEHHEALASYDLIPGLVCFAKTRWICDEVSRLHGGVMHRVIPSIDHEVYRTAADKPMHGTPLVVTAMIRPKTPRRGALRTMRVLGTLAERHGKRVRIETFGCPDENFAAYGLDHGFEFVNHGELRQPEVARVLADADVFLDLSDYQAFGRTAAEAMACGCVPIITRAGGAAEFLEDRRNGFLVDVNDAVQITAHVDTLVADRTLLRTLRDAALQTAARYSPVSAALSELDLFQEARRAVSMEPATPQLVLLPTRQKDGAPTAPAHVRAVLPYQHPRIATRYAVTIANDLPDSPPAVLVVQRSALYKTAGDPIKKLREWQRRGTRIVLDIDDDLFDPEPLRARMPGDDVDALSRHMHTLVSMADAVFVTTETLASRLKPLCGDRVRIIPNGLDEQTWLLGGKFVPRDDRAVKIGYIGTSTHDDDLAMIQGAVARIRSEYGSRVEFELIGGSKTADAKLWKRISLPSDPKHRAYPHFVKWLRARVDWHIGLVPLTGEVFNSCKSPLKYFDYSALGLATICSDRLPYCGVVSQRKTGLLVPDSEEAWYGAMKELIEDVELRRQLSEAAHEDVVRYHSLQQISRKLLAALDEMLKPAHVPASVPKKAATRRAIGADRPEQKAAVAPDSKRPSVHVHTEILEPQGSWRRKLRKLVRDPKRFILDSKHPLLRRAGALIL